MLNVEQINLDDTDVTELVELRLRLDREIDLRRRQISYIDAIKSAKEHRKAGNIKIAVDWEATAQALYDMMPKEIKW